MKLSLTRFNQLRFNIQKHFMPKSDVKAFTMEALGHKGKN